jgi:hypothetical protein
VAEAILVPLARVGLGERRREENGDVAALAASIARYGLLHPLVVDDDCCLIAGGRRLLAVQQLGWESVPVRPFGSLGAAERREIELEENLQRKDLTAYERSKTTVALAETAAVVLNEEAAPPGFRPDSGQNPAPTRGGRPAKADSVSKVAARIGVPATTLNEAQHHVETASEYPFMQRSDWQQYHVLEARALLEKLPADERPRAAVLLDQPGVPPPDGLRMLATLGELSPVARADIYRLAESGDEDERTRALTRAARRPLMVDPRIGHLTSVLSDLGRCIAAGAADPVSLRLKAVRDDVAAIRGELKEAYARERDADLAIH